MSCFQVEAIAVCVCVSACVFLVCVLCVCVCVCALCVLVCLCACCACGCSASSRVLSRVAFNSFHCPVLFSIFSCAFTLLLLLLFVLSISRALSLSLSLSLLPIIIQRGALFSGSMGQRRRRRRGVGRGERTGAGWRELMSGVARSFRSRNESMQVIQCNARAPSQDRIGGERVVVSVSQSARLSGCLLLLLLLLLSSKVVSAHPSRHRILLSVTSLLTVLQCPLVMLVSGCLGSRPARVGITV